jgi:hypothetical protein
MNSGSTFSSRFTIHNPAHDLLSRIGIGEIYRATDIQTGETVVVKASTPEVLERFVREGAVQRFEWAAGESTA